MAVPDTGHRRLLSLFKEIPVLEEFFTTKSKKSKKKAKKGFEVKTHSIFSASR
jgi:predicted transcriptional regulator